MVINATGNVGIGTDNPQVRAHVHTDSNTIKTSMMVTNNYAGQNGTGSDIVESEIIIGTINYYASIRAVIPPTKFSDAARIDFCTGQVSNINTQIPRMTILSGASTGGATRVGINTTNPLYTLDVSGTLRATNILYSGNITTSTTYIGIGTASPEYPLDVKISKKITVGYHVGHWTSPSASIQTTTRFTDFNIGIYSAYSIQSGTGFIIYSDARIKNNITDLDDIDALHVLRKINPVKYGYIDKVKRGNDTVYGFIAQQVKEHLPYAVGKVQEFIPNYYNIISVSPVADSSNIYLCHDISASFLATISPESYVKCIDISNNEHKCTVIHKTDTTMTISFGENVPVFDASMNIFLYGSHVDDFNILNKDHLFTVNFAATQEIDRIVAAQAERIRVLEATVASQAERIRVLEATVAEEVASNVSQQETIDTIILQLAQVKQFINMP
jgi:hypothetical protein